MIPEIMRITQVAKQTNATPDEIRYFEKKGYIKSRWMRLSRRRIRDYAPVEVQRIELIVKYRRLGFEHDMAFKKALEEMGRPRLL